MITEWLMTLSSGVLSWFIGLWPQGGVPTWFTPIAGYLQSVINSGAGLSPWIPWPLVITIGLAAIAYWSTLLLVKIARWLLGLVPTMGGG